MKPKKLIQSLDDLIHSEKYQSFESETLYNIQYWILQDSSKIDDDNDDIPLNITNQDVIDNWKDFLNSLNVFETELAEIEDINNYDITDIDKDRIFEEIEKVENYHIEQNTINYLIF